jgi:hypothetical protein
MVQSLATEKAILAFSVWHKLLNHKTVVLIVDHVALEGKEKQL